MATDGPPVADCDAEVFAKGTCVLMVGTITPNRMERWVQEIAAETGMRVDWNYAAGRAIVRALGDVPLVRDVVDRKLPELEALIRESIYCDGIDDGKPLGADGWMKL